MIEFAMSRLGRGLILAVALVAAFLVNNSHQRSIGAEKVLVASKENGAKANVKNEAVRARADTPGAAERVRDRFCREC